MVVVCINDMYSTLTLNKSYKVLHTFDLYYYMEIDNSENFYPRSLFMTLEEYRNRKLDQIL